MKNSFTKKLADPFLYVFWKTQIDILSACPPLQNMAFRSGIGTDRSRRLWLTMLRRIVKGLPTLLSSHLRDLRQGRIVLTNVTFGVTSRCTLRCDKCLVRMPDWPNPSDFPASRCIRELEALFAFADFIYTLNISGGEPFLHTALDEILLACAASDKIAHISVATNGTIVPNKKQLAALRAANATVRISKYRPELQPEVETLKHVLEQNSILYIHESGAFWYDLGDENICDNQGKRRFRVCSQRLCLIYYDKKLFQCCQTINQMQNGIQTDSKDYIDLRATDPSSFRAQWNAFGKKRVLSACSRCLGFTYKTPRIPIGTQRDC